MPESFRHDLVARFEEKTVPCLSAHERVHFFRGDPMMRKTVRRMAQMCDEAWYIFMGTLKLSCAMLLCAFLLLVSPDCTYEQTMLAAALAETPQGLGLVALIVSLLLEERRAG